MAEAIAHHLISTNQFKTSWHFDSAGTSDYHIGELPDQRVRSLLKAKGLHTSHRARQFVPEDMGHFSYIFAMDKDNYKNIQLMSVSVPENLYLMRDYDPESRGEDVPDPYYGGEKGFEAVYSMLSRAIQSFFDQHEREKGISFS